MDQKTGPTLILIVEDDPILMMALVDFVEQAGFEAVEATDIDQAIAILETRTDIRTVFTDLDTRNSKDGIKMALAIRDRWPPIEILMISSLPWEETDLPKRGVLLGKPFDQRRIVSTLKELAGQPSA